MPAKDHILILAMCHSAQCMRVHPVWQSCPKMWMEKEMFNSSNQETQQKRIRWKVSIVTKMCLTLWPLWNYPLQAVNLPWGVFEVKGQHSLNTARVFLSLQLLSPFLHKALRKHLICIRVQLWLLRKQFAV